MYFLFPSWAGVLDLVLGFSVLCSPNWGFHYGIYFDKMIFGSFSSYD